MRNLINQFKEDKVLRRTVYIMLAIISFVTVAVSINPLILLYTFAVLIIGLIVALVGVLIYTVLDHYRND